MNILDIQDKLKGLSQEQLAQEMQSPTGQVPQFLVLSEMSRRQAMQQSMQQQNAGSQTVAQELLNGAGVPSEGMTDMAQTMAPKSSIAENTGIGSLPQEAPPPEEGGLAALAAQEQQPVGMADGGPVRKMYDGSAVTSEMTPEDLVAYQRNRFYRDAYGNIMDRITGKTSAIAAGLNDMRSSISSAEAGIGSLIPGLESFTVNERKRAEEEAALADQQRNFSEQRNQEVMGATELQNPSIRDALRNPNPLPVAADAPAVPPVVPDVNDQGAGGSGGSGSGGGSGSSGSGGGGKMSSYEQMLTDAMKNAEKTAKQDKWLALAQAGAALYSGASVGDAVNTGISALQSARDTGDQNKLKLAQEMYGIQERQAALARAAASAGAEKSKPRSETSILSGISSIDEILNNMVKTDELGQPLPLDPMQQEAAARLMDKKNELLGMLQGTGVDLSDPVQ